MDEKRERYTNALPPLEMGPIYDPARRPQRQRRDEPLSGSSVAVPCYTAAQAREMVEVGDELRELAVRAMAQLKGLREHASPGAQQRVDDLWKKLARATGRQRRACCELEEALAAV